MEMIQDADLPLEMRRELLAAATDKQISYEWLCNIYRRGAATQIVPGPTGGKADEPLPNDLGELLVLLSIDIPRGLVRLSFGKPVQWLALPAAHAVQLATELVNRANQILWAQKVGTDAELGDTPDPSHGTH
jgi:hypothetical protein